MNRKIFFASLVVVLLLATAVVPVSAAQPQAGQFLSPDMPTWSLRGGKPPIGLPGGFHLNCGCETGGNCSC